MRQEPLVTVVIPCRGRQALLARALRSLREQSEPRWRALVVDDASDPPLTLRAATADPRVRLLRLPANRGPGAAREAGLARTATPWAAFLDSDDVWHPDWLARQLSAASPGQVAVCAAEVAGPGGRLRRRPARGTRPGERIGRFLYVANGFAQSSGILAPAALARATGFGGLRQYEDHLFLIRAEALGAEIRVRPEALYTQTADAGAARAGRRDDPARARAFLAAAGPALDREARAAFALRCLGPALAGSDRAAALRLAARAGARHPSLSGAAAKLALRALTGGDAYDAARAALTGWRRPPAAAAPCARRPRAPR